jgi:hypothetical protein
MFRSILAVPLLAALAVPVAACSVTWDGDDAAGDAVAAQGSGGSRTYAVRDFDSVALGGVGDVEVRVGGDWSVTATGAPAALDKLLIERDGDTLKLGRKRGMQWGKSEKIRFTVTMPRIEEASIGGAGSITVDRVPAGSFSGNIGGSGRLDIRNLAVDKAEFAIGGSGTVLASGRARALEATIGGSGNLQLKPLSTETAEITIAGAGNVDVTASRTADVTIVGSGNVTVGGGAKCSTTKLGGGTIRCG